MDLYANLFFIILTPLMFYISAYNSNNSYKQIATGSRILIELFEPNPLLNLKPNLNVMQIGVHKLKYKLSKTIEYLSPHYGKLNRHINERIRAIFPNYKVIVQKTRISLILFRVIRFNFFIVVLSIYLVFNIIFRLILNAFCIIDCILYLPLLLLNYEILKTLKPIYFKQNLIRQRIMLQSEFSTFFNAVIICFVIALLVVIFNLSFKQRTIFY